MRCEVDLALVLGFDSSLELESSSGVEICFSKGWLFVVTRRKLIMSFIRVSPKSFILFSLFLI